MSRHRDVRNLDIDAVLHEDNFDEEPPILTAEQESVKQVYNIIGEDTGLSREKVEEALWYYYFDVEASIDYLLKEIANSKKSKKKSNKSKDDENEFDNPLTFDKIEPGKAATPPIKSSKLNSTSPSDVVLKTQSKSSGLNKVSKSATPIASPKPVNQLELDMQAMNLTTTPTESERISTPVPSNKRIDVVKAYMDRNQQRNNLNLIIVGHVDAGKSTLMGHLLYKVGKVDERTMRKFERESEKLGKKSFAYAWILDETSEERERGVTVDIATAQFQTDKFNVTVLDAPGHKDFIPNMISGANQADVAVLVVDATPGEFESGFQGQGQTREHALLIRSLGVKQLIIAINKLDMTTWSQPRFEAIRQQLNEFLTSAGFPPTNLIYIPVSGLHGHNLEQQVPTDHPLRAWYHGLSLVQAIDQFEPPARPVDLPLRLPVSDFFKGGINNVSGVTISGRIVQGHLQLGEVLRILPGDEQATVKSIEVDETNVDYAVAGDSVLLTLANLDILQLRPGSVLCKPDNLIPVTNRFQAQILVFEPAQPITLGTSVVIHHQSLDLSAHFTELVATLDKSTGVVTRNKPRVLPKQSSATVVVQTLGSIAVEPFNTCKELARVTFRKNGATIATGIVQKVLPPSSN